MKFIKGIGVPYSITIIVVYLIWKLMAILVSQNVLPYPEDVIQAFLAALLTPEFWNHFSVSAFRVLMAMIIGWGIAFPVGILMGSSPRFDKFLSPFVSMTYPIPKVVLLPVVLLLFGLGDFSKIMIISLILGYQVLVATRDGVRCIQPQHLDSIRSLGANRLQLFWEGYLPAALPHGFTALRLN